LRFVNASDGYANLRTGPGTEYDVICRVPNGHDLEVYRKKGTSKSGKNWLKVTYFTEADNEDGYMWLDGWIAESQLD
ncbi:MAG: SH3 domain-containing protein, partial [Lachnospiraceae bacterium]|nr:SH3 domain-containing protein [Lachnospiraceae bacterium]